MRVDDFLNNIKNKENDKSLVYIFTILDNCDNNSFFNELFIKILNEDFNEDINVALLSATIDFKSNSNRKKYVESFEDVQV